MSVIWSKDKNYRKIDYENEADLEDSIIEIQENLFGVNRFYIDTKRLIGQRGGVQNIPDGYLFDLSSSKPMLYLVENELDVHHHLKHISVQILEFSLSFETSNRKIREILISQINSNSSLKVAVDNYISNYNYRSYEALIENMLEKFNVLVIIDKLSEDLERALTKQFSFNVNVIEVSKFQTEDGSETQYLFEPIFDEIEETFTGSVVEPLSFEKLDTIVVPARSEGFQNTFIQGNRWYAIKIRKSRFEHIKYIAAYQVSPISAITHIAEVESIEPWPDTNKYVVNFKNPAREISHVKLTWPNGRIMPLQNSRYTGYDRLINASTLEDLW